MCCVASVDEVGCCALLGFVFIKLGKLIYRGLNVVPLNVRPLVMKP